MIITETPITPLDYQQWLTPRDTPPRTAGIHVSDVLRDMLVEIGRYEKESTFNDVRGDLGFAWEDVLSAQLAQRMATSRGEQRLPMLEYERDGIYGSPDGVLLADTAQHAFDSGGVLVPVVAAGEGFVEETKATWMSSTHSLDSPKLLPWVLQGKTYCCLVGCHALRIRAFFVNGNYKYGDEGTGPVVREWWVRFTQRDLDEWWAGFTRRAEKLRTEREKV